MLMRLSSGEVCSLGHGPAEGRLMTARLLESGPDEWHVFDDNDTSYLNYIGLIKKVGDRFRAHGTGLNLDFKVVSMESPVDFASIDQAEAWLFDEPGTEA